MGLHTEELKNVVDQFIQNKLLQFLIQYGNSVLDQHSLYSSIIRCINCIIEFIKYYKMEKMLTSQEVFDLFKLSLNAFKTDKEATILNMFRIIFISTDFLFNLIDFLDQEWIKEFLKYFGQWILLCQDNRVNLCLKLILGIFSKCQPIHIFHFLQDGELEDKLFQAANINRELTLQILLIMINCECEETTYMFQTRAIEILSIFSLCVTPMEIKIASSLMNHLLDGYLEYFVNEQSSPSYVMFILEDKYTSLMICTKTKLILLYCIYQVLANVNNSELTPSLRHSLEKDYQYIDNQDIQNWIEKIFELCEI